MKPFNLEAAKRGEKVITRNGKQARIICFDRVGGDCPLVALITSDEEYEPRESVRFYGKDGLWLDGNVLCREFDLVMAPVKRKLWIAIPKLYEGQECIGCTFANQKTAECYSGGGAVIEVEVEV